MNIPYMFVPTGDVVPNRYWVGKAIAKFQIVATIATAEKTGHLTIFFREGATTTQVDEVLQDAYRAGFIVRGFWVGPALSREVADVS